jgi:stalled ribosome alternative rescue factor ArfA
MAFEKVLTLIHKYECRSTGGIIHPVGQMILSLLKPIIKIKTLLYLNRLRAVAHQKIYLNKKGKGEYSRFSKNEFPIFDYQKPFYASFSWWQWE